MLNIFTKRTTLIIMTHFSSFSSYPYPDPDIPEHHHCNQNERPQVRVTPSIYQPWQRNCTDEEAIPTIPPMTMLLHRQQRYHTNATPPTMTPHWWQRYPNDGITIPTLTMLPYRQQRYPTNNDTVSLVHFSYGKQHSINNTSSLSPFPSHLKSPLEEIHGRKGFERLLRFQQEVKFG